MIKKLRWKFIAVAMISIIVVLMVIIGTITLINYNKTVDNIDKVLTVLVDMMANLMILILVMII